MAREEPKEFYVAKPSEFGNGAKLKAYKKYINKEMVIMTKEYWDKVNKEKKVSDNDTDKNDKKMAKRWADAEDKRTDDLIKEL